ncbi:MAG TPA: PAS domain-containing protein [Kofleriaceae bacterium]|jgi:PAS domain-containing protein|nr:PAS domain-containing protein [Kofleriaceae bacterium]
MLDDLDDQALDALPYGVICLDENLRVARMNRTECERTGIQRWRALGRPYFGDVAAGDRNRVLAESVAAFAQGRASARTFDHVFPRRKGADATHIELQQGRQRRVYLCIRRD